MYNIYIYVYIYTYTCFNLFKQKTPRNSIKVYLNVTDRFRQMSPKSSINGDVAVFWLHCYFWSICRHRFSGNGCICYQLGLTDWPHAIIPMVKAQSVPRCCWSSWYLEDKNPGKEGAEPNHTAIYVYVHLFSRFNPFNTIFVIYIYIYISWLNSYSVQMLMNYYIQYVFDGCSNPKKIHKS